MLHKLKAPSSFFQRLKATITAFINFTPLAISILIVNLLQFCSLLVKPFSPRLFRRINCAFGYLWWGSVVFLMEKIRKIEFIFSGEKTPVGESVALIANHQSMADVTAIWSLAIRKKRLGQLKWFAKDILKYVPGAGWGLYISGHFFVKRDWLRDQKRIDKVFERVLREKEPMWVISFLEGTRITAEKLKHSQQFCKERSRPIMEHILAPRTKGFEAIIRSLRSGLDAVYDVTIAFPDGIPTITQLFCGYITKVNIHVRRFPIQTIPLTDKEIGDWVWKIFAEKDELLKYFVRHNSFPGPVLYDPL